MQWSGPSPEQDPLDFQTISYKYDLYGRRSEKKVDGFSTRYLYDGGHVIAEYDGNNNLLRKYIYGPGIDQPVCMIEVADSNAVYYYHYDGLGSVVALSDENGDTVQTYQYSVYGQVAAEDVNHPNPYMFAGRRFDIETGLYYNRARYYNPYMGRFLQTDPVGYGEGINWYRYCGNNPILFIDPSGCEPEEDAVAGIISLCAITEGTFYNSWGMRITPDSSYKWETGKNLLDTLVDATNTYGEITLLNIFSHGWTANSDSGFHHRGGVWGQGPNGPSNAGFYGETKSWDHPESRDITNIQTLVEEGKIKFAENGVIFINACHAANTGWFCQALATETGCTVYAATGKVKEFLIGPTWVSWQTFAESSTQDPITWKKFLPDGSIVDLQSKYIILFQGNTAPSTSMPAETPVY